MPLIHALQMLPEGERRVLQNVLTQRRVNGKSTPEHKQLILDTLESAGSLEYTLDAVRLLQDEVSRELDAVEADTGVRNSRLRTVIEVIRI